MIMRLWNAFALPVIATLSFATIASAQDGGTTESKPAAKKEEKKPAAGDKKTDAKTGEAKPADAKAGDAKGGDAKATETKTADKPEVAGPEAKPTTGPTGAPKATAATGQVDGATYAVRLRDLEQRVDELKEQIRRSHTRLSLLSETILSGGVGGARAEIKFTNEMSNVFRLNRALFVLDGAVQYNKQDDTGALAAQKEIPIFSGSVPPGDHTMQVLLQFRGYGYGVFSYLRGYRFEVKSSHSFTVTEGKTMELEAVAYEKGGVTTPVEQRPAIRFVEKLRTGGS